MGNMVGSNSSSILSKRFCWSSVVLRNADFLFGTAVLDRGFVACFGFGDVVEIGGVPFLPLIRTFLAILGDCLGAIGSSLDVGTAPVTPYLILTALA